MNNTIQDAGECCDRVHEVRQASRLSDCYDVVVIGAGPAGLSAAAEMAKVSGSVLLIDENNSIGGQIYRSISRTTRQTHAFLGRDYFAGADLVDAFRRSACTYAPGATVWSLESLDNRSGRALEIGLSQGGIARLLRASHVIMATGAIERPMPVPGWTLPGVMTAGAGQIALKSAGLLPAGRTVLAGCGPLLYLLAAQIIAAGGEIAAILDTTDRSGWRKAAPFFFDFIRSPYSVKGLKLLMQVFAGIRIIRGVRELKVMGHGRAESLRYLVRGRTHDIAADNVLLHQGVIPNINLASAAGCALEWNKRQHAFQPRLDSRGQTSVAGIWAVGDGATIGGAAVAALSGRLVALEVLAQIDAIDAAGSRPRLQTLLKRQLVRQQRGRAFLDTLYRPSTSFLAPLDDTVVVCRCEEVSAGQVRQAIATGVPGPNQLKTFLRCGMGPCQGRLCASTITNMIAAERGISPAEVGTYRLRFPVKPLNLAELASIQKNPEAIMAVTGMRPEKET